MMRFSALIAIASCTFTVVGCSLVRSPAVGEWSGKMTAAPQSGMIGAFATGMTAAMGGDPSASLTLKSDGTGYMKVMTAPEQAITWKADGERILLYGMEKPSKAEASPAPEEPIIGKFSEDKKSLVFDLGPVQFNLAKKAE
ncbi:MAG: hypothetical protein H7145_03560 [Akkermansiaceae bacterium]|nr:hypothetical protein [Armatimonadota bacterium]